MAFQTYEDLESTISLKRWNLAIDHNPASCILTANKYDKEKVLRKRVIVDTNALLIPGVFGLDIFEELEKLGYSHIIVPKRVLNELEVLRQKRDVKGKAKMAANIGYLLVLKYALGKERIGCKVSIEEEGETGETDELIVERAIKLGAAVLTNDEFLRKRLMQAGIPTVYLRGRNRLEASE